jgi:hypothetical protein
MTVFILNASNLTQLLPKVLRIRDRNESLENVFKSLLRASQKIHFLGTLKSYTALTSLN